MTSTGHDAIANPGSSTRFVWKPERVSNVFLTYFDYFFRGQYKLREVERPQRGVKPANPRQIEHCLVPCPNDTISSIDWLFQSRFSFELWHLRFLWSWPCHGGNVLETSIAHYCNRAFHKYGPNRQFHLHDIYHREFDEMCMQTSEYNISLAANVLNRWTTRTQSRSTVNIS